MVNSGGTPSQNGAALRNALNGITDASASNLYLLKVEPGVYDLDGGSLLYMKPYVDIEVSGEGVTILTSISGFFTVGAADNTELRFLTVQDTGNNSESHAILSLVSSFRMTHVTAIASSSSSYNIGVDIQDGARRRWTR